MSSQRLEHFELSVKHVVCVPKFYHRHFVSWWSDFWYCLAQSCEEDLFEGVWHQRLGRKIQVCRRYFEYIPFLGSLICDTSWLLSFWSYLSPHFFLCLGFYIYSVWGRSTVVWEHPPSLKCTSHCWFVLNGTDHQTEKWVHLRCVCSYCDYWTGVNCWSSWPTVFDACCALSAGCLDCQLLK